MFKAVGEFVIKVVELAEAEGRQLRAIAARFGLGFAFVLMASLLGVIGFALVLYALFAYLSPLVGLPLAALITGGATLGTAGLLAMLGAAAMKGDGKRP